MCTIGMGIFQNIEELESIAHSLTRVEHDNFVSAGLVVLLVICEEYIGAQIGKHIANAINKYIRTLHFVDYADMIHHTLVYVFIKLLAVGLLALYLLYVAWRVFLHSHQELH